MNKQSQLNHAQDLGLQAFQNGITRTPIYDKELMKMLEGRTIGETPEGEATSIQLMNAWFKGWDKGNLTPVPESTEFDTLAHYAQL